MDDWAACDAEAVVTALSVRYRFSRANAVQLLRDQGILPQREAAAEEEEEDDVEEAEDWESEEEEETVEDQSIMLPGHELIPVWKSNSELGYPTKLQNSLSRSNRSRFG